VPEKIVLVSAKLEANGLRPMGRKGTFLREGSMRSGIPGMREKRLLAQALGDWETCPTTLKAEPGDGNVRLGTESR